MMDPDDQPSCMSIKQHHLDSANATELLSCFRQALPDFLTSQSSRSPIPKARWKDLFSSKPQSVAAMDKQLAKLMEQSLWLMVSDAAHSVPTLGCIQSSASTE